MKEILGKAKTIRELLGGAKYSIDYYSVNTAGRRSR